MYNTDDVDAGNYNDVASLSDGWVDSGYLTLQHNLNVYLAQQYSITTPVAVNTQVQRYPKSDVYEDTPKLDWTEIRFKIWKWMGSVVLGVFLTRQ